MSIFQRNLLTGSCSKPLVWLRYIDDILAICTYVKTNLKIFFSTLILSTHLFTLPVIIQKNVFSFFMSQVLLTILVTLRQICMSNLLTRPNIYWQLVVILPILNEAHLIEKLPVFFILVLTKKQPKYVLRSLWAA